MLQEKRFKKLRNRAEKMLGTLRIQQNDNLSKEYICELIRELALYQIELELQDEDLRKSQIELKESRNKYAELFDFAPIGYLTLDCNGSILEVNQVGASLLGVTKQALLNKNLSRYISPDLTTAYLYYFSQLNDSQVKTCELKLLKKHGAIFDAQLSGKIVINPRTLTKELLIMITDMTEHKKNQGWDNSPRQNHLNRANSMGQLTSTIAHEINQPLAVIGNYIHGCILRLENKNISYDILLQTMHKASEQLQRISEIMLRMRNFAYKGILKRESHDINMVIHEAIKLINCETPSYPVKLQYRPLAKPSVVVLDIIQIQQVILNLARNSLEAMKDATTQNPSIIIESNQLNKNQIEISIIDNGPGISQEVVHKLFDPYFTTKPYGVGLGLAVSRTIIESHGGKLLVETNMVYGTCFKIIIPLKD